MHISQPDEVTRALKTAIEATIAELGLAALKETTLFMSSKRRLAKAA